MSYIKMKYLDYYFIVTLLFLASICTSCTEKRQPPGNYYDYSIYDSFESLIASTDSNYIDPIRITAPGTADKPMDHGFWFYNCMHKELLQFDPSGRYMLSFRVFFEGRDVEPTDKGEVGIIDLKNNNEWTKIGESTTWNWQQGNRLQWIPGSLEEIIWNDRADNGQSFVSRIYNTRTKITRTLPRPIYTISPDGKTALTHDFERMKHGGTNYVGIDDKYEGQWAPEGVNIWKMDVETGESIPIISITQMASLMYPEDYQAGPGRTLYFFREGFNPSGERFIFFVKDAQPGKRARTEGFSANIGGSDIKYLYKEPSHHFWLNNEQIMDNGWHTPPDRQDSVRGYFLFHDDGSGQAKKMYFEAPNGHITISKDGNWILTDTYNMNGFIYLYLYHLPTKKLVPLAKLETHFKRKQTLKKAGYYRIDLHPRYTPDGRKVCIDSSHEGLGRQIYILDIGHIIDNPPTL